MIEIADFVVIWINSIGIVEGWPPFSNQYGDTRYKWLSHLFNNMADGMRQLASDSLSDAVIQTRRLLTKLRLWVSIDECQTRRNIHRWCGTFAFNRMAIIGKWHNMAFIIIQSWAHLGKGKKYQYKISSKFGDDISVDRWRANRTGVSPWQIGAKIEKLAVRICKNDSHQPSILQKKKNEQ